MPQLTLDNFLVRTHRENPQQPLERWFVEKQIQGRMEMFFKPIKRPGTSPPVVTIDG
jgi:hypothetical protein